MLILFVLLLVLLFAGLGFALHLLWILAAIFLVFWLAGVALGRGEHGEPPLLWVVTPKYIRPPSGSEKRRSHMTDESTEAKWSVAEWHGKMLLDRDGEKIGKLQDVYVDVETDEPQFGTVKEGFIGRHLTFVPLAGLQIGTDDLQVTVTKDQVKSAPDIEMHGEELSQADESTLYHHFEMNYTPITTESGRRLARR